MSEKVVVEFCNEMLSTRSIKQKKEILSKYSDQVIVVSVLKFLLDKTPSGMTLKRLSKSVEEVTDCTGISSLEDAIQYLKTNNSGEDYDIRLIQEYLESIPESYKETVTSILTKDLRLGVDIKTVATVVSEFNQQLNVQIPVPFSSSKLESGEWVCVSEVVEGNRAVFVDGKLLLLDGTEVPDNPRIISSLNTIASRFPMKVVFDGILNVDSGVFTIIDMLAFDDFMSGECTLGYHNRHNEIMGLSVLLQTIDNVSIPPLLYEGYDHECISTCFNKVKTQSKLGCFVHLDAAYKAGENPGFLIMNTFNTSTFPVVAFDTNESGEIQCITVDYNGFDVILECDITSELSDVLKSSNGENVLLEIRHKGITCNSIVKRYKLSSPTIIGFTKQDKS